jgi:hypothetical protein
VSRSRLLVAALAGVAVSATSATAQARRVTGVVTATGTNEPLNSASVQ